MRTPKRYFCNAMWCHDFVMHLMLRQGFISIHDAWHMCDTFELVWWSIIYIKSTRCDSHQSHCTTGGQHVVDISHFSSCKTNGRPDNEAYYFLLNGSSFRILVSLSVFLSVLLTFNCRFSFCPFDFQLHYTPSFLTFIFFIQSSRWTLFPKETYIDNLKWFIHRIMLSSMTGEFHWMMSSSHPIPLKLWFSGNTPSSIQSCLVDSNEGWRPWITRECLYLSTQN